MLQLFPRGIFLKPSHFLSKYGSYLVLSLRDARNNNLLEQQILQATNPPFPPPNFRTPKPFPMQSTGTNSATNYTLPECMISLLMLGQSLFIRYRQLGCCCSPITPAWLSSTPSWSHAAAELTTESILCREPRAAAACCWVLRASAKLLALALLLLKAGIVAREHKLHWRKRALGRKPQVLWSPTNTPSLWAQLHKFLFRADYPKSETLTTSQCKEAKQCMRVQTDLPCLPLLLQMKEKDAKWEDFFINSLMWWVQDKVQLWQGKMSLISPEVYLPPCLWNLLHKQNIRCFEKVSQIPKNI